MAPDAEFAPVHLKQLAGDCQLLVAHGPPGVALPVRFDVDSGAAAHYRNKSEAPYDD